ncbi:cytochrome P450 [Streptomyces sp. NPDC050617]|uniref:cytochrome P450 n=1 Tax=Streptomyces sp. NPDC050617 TaxID=3154628 RepID=UPI00343192BD
MSTPSGDRPHDGFPYPPGPHGDPPPEYARLRDEAPLTRIRLPGGHDAWLATRYDDVVTVTADPRFARDDRYLFMPIPAENAAGTDRGNGDGDGDGEEGASTVEDRGRADRTAGGAADDDRTDGGVADDDRTDRGIADDDRTDRERAAQAAGRRRLRDTVQDALRPWRAQRWQGRVDRAVRERLDALEAAGPPADLVRQYAFPVPIAVVCELLGIPDRDRDRFHEWANVRLSVTAYSKEEVAAAFQAYEEYVGELIDRRRRAPRDGLLDELIRVRDADAHISDYDLRRMVRGLITAGHQASTNMITRGALLLLRHPGELARLRREPALIDSAVEEILRYHMPGDTAVPRVAEVDVPLSGGVVRRGEVVLAPPVSANRDERRFPDPDRFDIARTDNAHLTFGHGAHYCLGASLARIELRTALGMLVARFPRLAPAVAPERLRWTDGLLVRQLEELPVTW